MDISGYVQVAETHILYQPCVIEILNSFVISELVTNIL